MSTLAKLQAWAAERKAEERTATIAVARARAAPLVRSAGPTRKALDARLNATNELNLRNKGRIGYNVTFLPPMSDGQGGVRVAMVSGDARTLVLNSDANGQLRVHGRPLTVAEAIHMARFP